MFPHVICNCFTHQVPLRRLLWLASIVWTLLISGIVQGADEPRPRIDSVDVGFRGVVEAGRWSPVLARFSGPAGTRFTPRITASDIEGRPVRMTGVPVTISNGQETVSFVYQHGPLGTPLTIEMIVDGQVAEARTVHPDEDNVSIETASQLTDLVLCLGGSVVGLDQAALIASEIRRTRPEQVAPLIVQNYSADQMEELPLTVQGWESVDVVIVGKDCHITPRLGGVLREYVEAGGRLVLLGGEQVTSVNTPELQSWLPVRLQGTLNFRDITELNRAVPGSATLRLREGNLRAVHWEAHDAAILTQSLEGPIAIRTGYGLGTVSAIALDLNAPPFARMTGTTNSVAWDSLPDLCRWLSGLKAIPRVEESAQRPQSDLNPTGVSDVQTQLVNTLDHFPEVDRPSYWVVLGGILLLVVVAGPLDYLIVHRLLKRPHWTWATLPLWIVSATAAGLAASDRLNGSRDLTRQLDLVTWDAGSQTAQLDSWLSIYSARHHRYDVQSQLGTMIGSAPNNTMIRWSGRPEAGFRGIYRTPATRQGAAIEYAADASRLQTLPIRQASSTVVETKSHWSSAPPIQFDLRDNGDGHLIGNFQHQLDGELVDWVLAYRSFAYLPVRDQTGSDRPLGKGTDVHVEAAPSRLLIDYLVGRGAKSVKRADRKTVDFIPTRDGYDPMGRDLSLVLRSLTFHQICETQSFVNLTNSTLQAEDLSRLIDSNRAVIFGRWRNSAYLDPEAPIDSSESATELLATEYTIDGQRNIPRYRECFVRWILPVHQPGPGHRKPLPTAEQ